MTVLFFFFSKGRCLALQQEGKLMRRCDVTQKLSSLG